MLLSVYGASSTKGKVSIIVNKNGKNVIKKVLKCSESNPKKGILVAVAAGLKECRQYVSHDDFLVIEVQNWHLVEWLNEVTFYKGYTQYLDDVYSVLETLDCKYRFVFQDKPSAESIIDDMVEEVNMFGVDVLTSMEG